MKKRQSDGVCGNGHKMWCSACRNKEQYAKDPAFRERMKMAVRRSLAKKKGVEQKAIK